MTTDSSFATPTTTTSSSAHCSLITDHSSPLRPEWDAVRETTALITHHGRQFLRGQVRLGMLLAGLKKAHGIQRGGDQKSNAGIRPSIPWKDLVMAETGIERHRADEFIRLYEATCAKMKRSKTLALPEGLTREALVLFQPENALALTEDHWLAVDELIGTLTTGETQASLLTELGVIARPRSMPSSNESTKTKEESEEVLAGQLAFHFFEAMAAPMINARLSPDYLKLLHALPLHSTAEHPLSLATLEAEARAMLADIERVKEAAAKSAKSAKGRVL
jgi:hypothetical protein